MQNHPIPTFEPIFCTECGERLAWADASQTAVIGELFCDACHRQREKQPPEDSTET